MACYSKMRTTVGGILFHPACEPEITVTTKVMMWITSNAGKSRAPDASLLVFESCELEIRKVLPTTFAPPKRC